MNNFLVDENVDLKKSSVYIGYVILNELKRNNKISIIELHHLLKKKIGDVKLVLTTGVFMNYAKGKLDLLLVVDNVSRVKLKTLINHLEAEVGKEIRYMVLTGEELTYRLNMLDRFLINIFKEPHEIFFSKVPKIKQIVSVLKK